MNGDPLVKDINTIISVITLHLYTCARSFLAHHIITPVSWDLSVLARLEVCRTCHIYPHNCPTFLHILYWNIVFCLSFCYRSYENRVIKYYWHFVSVQTDIYFLVDCILSYNTPSFQLHNIDSVCVASVIKSFFWSDEWMNFLVLQLAYEASLFVYFHHACSH